MEIIFNYETAKHTVVLAAYTAIIIFDVFWISYSIISISDWCVKKIRALYKRKFAAKETKEDTIHE